MKKIVKSIVVLCALQGADLALATSWMRSPNFFDSWNVHYPFEFDSECAWSDCEQKGLWELKTINGFYAFSADKTFRSEDCDSDKKCTTPSSMPSFNHVTTDTEPLAALFFGKACFLGEEAFPNAATPATCGIPTNTLSGSIVSPKFEYNEYGIVIGFDTFKKFGCKDQWRVGTRVLLPLKVIDVRQTSNGGTETPAPTELLSDQVRYSFVDVDPAAVYREFHANAYRFDLLTSLKTPGGQPLLTATANDLYIYGSQIDSSSQQTATFDVLRRTSETIDVKYDVLYQEPPSVFNCAGLCDKPLSANGVEVNDGRYWIAQTRDYSAILADPEVQKTLFLVPSSNQDTRGLNFVGQVQNLIDQAIQQQQALLGDAFPTQQFFKDTCCIDFFDSSRTVGVGDLEMTFYGGYHQDDWFTDLMFNVRFPAGRKNNNPRKLLYQTTGNNGHVEVGPGLEAGWQGCSCFAVTFGAAYFKALSAQEKKAAAFTGATVINIGPNINADVSFSYVTGHLDMTMFHPRNKNLGGTFGYELFAKQKDKVSFCQKTATDCCGNTATLDATLLENNTNTQTHKLRGTVFNRTNCWEFFAGASYIVAGRNAMQEAEWLLGINVYF